jgi:hypothetical protein
MSQLAALDKARFYLFEWNSLFMPPRPGEKHILDVFPQLPMFLQVDLNGHFPTLLIGHVLDSGHDFIFPSVLRTNAF